MNQHLSPNTQAVLLLTAPLSTGHRRADISLVAPARYRRLARLLYDAGLEPADMLGQHKSKALAACREVLSAQDADRLLGRGLQLSRALDYWRARSIWVLGRADANYPVRIREKLREAAPPILYGCGEISLLGGDSLAIVGSRAASSEVLEETARIARLAAQAGIAVVSGGARGVDQIAMQSALDAGGRAVGVLADGLERKILDRNYRTALMDQQLVLLSPFDPGARFFVDCAMRRNKLIYALADAGLVMEADRGNGGTWAGAVEQLDRLRLTPMYVRADQHLSLAAAGLIQKGAQTWPNPVGIAALRDIINAPSSPPRVQSLFVDAAKQKIVAP